MLTTDTKSTQNYQDKNISINKMNRYGVNLTKKKKKCCVDLDAKCNNRNIDSICYYKKNVDHRYKENINKMLFDFKITY